jgi:7-cyano-7-deazaguanine reductase
MSKNPLGKVTEYKSTYDKSLLFPISREQNRKRLGIEKVIFQGYDAWNSYEVSFLNKNGKPEVRRCSIVYSSDSQNIVESKSLKLYLNSFCMTSFEDEKDVLKIIKNDLKQVLKTDFLEVKFFDFTKSLKYFKIDKKLVIDDLDVEISKYNLDSELLKVNKDKNDKVYELYSNLLKTNCPITGQPDWATVYVKYKSDFKLDESSFLKYLVSFRNHNDYHESCCETIFRDVFEIVKPEVLVVKCFFTRRGGIDINPCRFYGEIPDNKYYLHFWRQ